MVNLLVGFSIILLKTDWIMYRGNCQIDTWALQHGLVQVDIQNQDIYKQKSFSILILCWIICLFCINGRQVSFKIKISVQDLLSTCILMIIDQKELVKSLYSFVVHRLMNWWTFLFTFQTRLPNIKVHAYFAPVTPPPAVGSGRQRYCKCCVILWL